MREDFMRALDDMIQEFAKDPGISDDEIIVVLEEYARLTRRAIIQLEGAAPRKAKEARQ